MRWFKQILRRSTPEVDAAVNDIREHGVTLLPHYFSTEVVAQLRAEVDRSMVDHASVLWKDAKGSDERLTGIECASARIRQVFYEDSFIREVGHEYMGAREKAGFVMAGRMIHVPGNLGSGGGWHRDSSARRQYKALVYLTDVDMNSGPFEYLVHSHRPGLDDEIARAANVERRERRFTDAQVGAVMATCASVLSKRTILAPAGSVILVDTHGLHRGAPIHRGTRYALTRYCWHYGPMPGHMTPALKPA